MVNPISKIGEELIKHANNKNISGIIPISGWRKSDFNVPWDISLNPVGKNYLAVERAVFECACAGVGTIWIVCNHDMQPLIRKVVGEMVRDPYSHPTGDRYLYKSGFFTNIPIFYVSVDVSKMFVRDSYGHSILWGAYRAFRSAEKWSKYVIPSKYYVAFPLGVYNPMEVIEFRTKINSDEPFFFSHKGKTVKDNKLLGFTFDIFDWKNAMKVVKSGTRVQKYENNSVFTKRTILPKEEQYSGRNFELNQIFADLNEKDKFVHELDRAYEIGTYEGYREFMGSNFELGRPNEIYLGYREWLPIATDDPLKSF